jgi:hypothetical protein
MASSESKDESKGEFLGEEEAGLIRVDAIRVGPSMCSISEPLEISLSYTLAEGVKGAQWNIAYLVDSVRKRHLVQLGRGELSDLPAGIPLSLSFRTGVIEVSHLKPSQLCNAGLLILTLHGRTAADSEDAELGSVQLVVQAMASAGTFIRSILNPWE